MALKEFGGGGRYNFIFNPEEKQGEGWWRMAEVLWECVAEGGVKEP